ncbi:GNAT family N-acetyltransferase [Roseibium aggregatum]|uniref:GNAT family N-acetyltransferase n=1 Tax=Roseibium aggregatum TaxID=187304 RepID=UPI00226C3896
MKALFEAGNVSGLVAMHDEEAVGWIQIYRRSAFPPLGGSRTLKPVDDKEVWSVSCFFIDKRFRRQGLSLRLLLAAIDWARD